VARLPRFVAPGVAHHVTQRGNHRQEVFFDDEDRRVYLAALAENAAKYGARLLGYCLMSNHVHAIAVPEGEESLAKAFGRAHADYARWLHVRHRQTGHLWQNRFYSCALDAGYCWAALRYVEQNPVRVGLVAEAWSWPWSSAKTHIAPDANDPLVDLAAWRACWNPQSWQRALAVGVRDALLEERLRQATKTGRPFGAAGFAESMERIAGRPLVPSKRGRKPAAGAAGSGA